MELVERVESQKLRFSLIIVLVLLVFNQAYAEEFDISELRQGWQLFKLKKYSQSAEIWHNNSLEFIRVKRDKNQLRLAAFAEVLSAIAYEKDSNIKAYQAWATGQTYLLESNIRWSEFQKKLQALYEEKLNWINQASSGQVQIGISLLESQSQKNSLLILDLERELALSQYRGPEPGLYTEDRPTEIFEEEGRLAKRSYVARPVVASFEVVEVPDSIVSRAFRTTPIVENSDDLIESRGVPSVKSSLFETKGDLEPLFSEINITPTGNKSIDAPEGGEELNDNGHRRMMGGRGLSSANIDRNNQDKIIATKAWQYFIHNVDGKTGLSYDTHDYPYSTMWGVGSYIAGVVSAHRLGVISLETFNARFKLLINSLNQMPLYNGEMPNRQYKVDTLGLVDIKNNSSDVGSGWSAIGIGRLLIWLKIVDNWYPGFQNDIQAFIGRLDLDRLLKNSELNGVFYDGFSETIFNEGRFGYEQYAAMGYKLWGYSVANALNYESVVFKSLYDIDVPIDSREGAYLVSDPFLLAAMEFSLVDEDFNRYTQRIYQVQKKHSLAIKHPVAQTEINLHQTPWFAYLSIFDNNKAWQVASNEGGHYPNFSGYSTHGVFMLDAVFSDDHTHNMLSSASKLVSDDLGFYTGESYDGEVIRALSSHSNGSILQSLLFKKLNEAFINSNIKVVQQ